MAATGGPVRRVSIDGRNFAVAADADATRSLGGTTNAIEMNGDGTGRIVKTREPWSVSGLTVSCNDAQDDQGYLQEKANSTNFFPCEVEFASGDVFSGTGQLTDKIEFSSGKSTCAISLGGPGELDHQ